ncbi:MAG: hypothetical protein ABFS02_02460 [Pseudomonadota bacterium]
MQNHISGVRIYLGSEPFIDRLKNPVSPGAGLDEIPKAQRCAAAKPLKNYVADFVDPK